MHATARRRAASAALLLVAAMPPAARAQGSDSSAFGGTFFTRRDAALAALFTAGTIAMFPLDRSIAMGTRGSSLQRNDFVRRSANLFRITAIPGSTIIGGSMYAIGRLSHSEHVAELGLHGTEALLVGQLIGSTVKGVLGRARPYEVADTNAKDFELMRGFRKGNDFSSLPSGHTIAAFAAATAVTDEVDRWWPNTTPYVATVMYSGAVLVALERLYDDKHWASDVVLGAGIGVFSALKVMKYNHDNPGNRVDHLFLVANIGPSAGGGSALSFSLRPLR